ncbi:MAG TPA: PRC-barrel domain-containing protein [Stellaceae bacterium]|nr:PRC-barrel domain-containing protein [Stellaceae bacterium]
MVRHFLVTTVFLVASVPALAQTSTPTSPVSPAAQPAQQDVITKQDNSQVRVYRLVGSKVVGPDGQTVGKVDDLLLDRDQKLAGVIVSVGGFLGVGSKSVALPPDRVDISQAYGEERVVKIEATKQELSAAPAFKTLEVQKAEADEKAARARALQNMPPGSPTPGSPISPLAPVRPPSSPGSSTQ